MDMYGRTYDYDADGELKNLNGVLCTIDECVDSIVSEWRKYN